MRNSRFSSLFLIVFLAQIGLVFGQSVASKVQEGNLRYAQKMYEQALQLYNDALQDKPRQEELLYNIANTFYRLGKYPEATSELKKGGYVQGTVILISTRPGRDRITISGIPFSRLSGTRKLQINTSKHFGKTPTIGKRNTISN